MPDQNGVASLDDLTQMWRQQNPNQPLPIGASSEDASTRGLQQVPGDPGAFAGSSKAMDMLSRYNQFMQQQTANGGTPPGGVTDSVGGQPPMTAGGVGGPTPAAPSGGPVAHTAVPGMAPTGGGPPPGGGFPTANGQGVIPANGVFGGPAVDNPRITGGVGVTPSAGLNNGDSLPPAAAGGSNMRIQNGAQIQDVQYTPNAGGPGVTATTMRDAGTGVTFVMGPNGQYYPAGSTQQPAAPGQGVTPGQSFGNAQTNLIQLGAEQDQANKLGMTPDGPTLAALRQIRLMGASPTSPVGQAVINQTLRDYNQHQTELEKTRIAVGPANRRADLEQQIFSKEDKKAYNDSYAGAVKRMNQENAALPPAKRRSQDEIQTLAQREANQELWARQGQMGGPAGVRGASQPATPGSPAPTPGGSSSQPAGGGLPSRLPPGNPGVLNTPAARATAAGQDDNEISSRLIDELRNSQGPDGTVDAAKFVTALGSLPGVMQQGALNPAYGDALKKILAGSPVLAQNFRANLASHFLNLAGQSQGARPWNNIEMAGMVGGAAPGDTALGVGESGPGKSSATQAFAGGSLVGGLGTGAVSNLLGRMGLATTPALGAGTAAAATAAPTLTPGATAPAAGGVAARVGGWVGGGAQKAYGTVPGQLGLGEAGAGMVNRNVGESFLSAMNPANTHLGVYDQVTGEFIPSNNATRNTSIGNYVGGSIPQQQLEQQMMASALLMRYMRAGQ